MALNRNTYILHPPLTPHIPILNPHKPHQATNLIFHKTPPNTNPILPIPPHSTIAQLQHILPLPNLHPHQILTPALFLNHILQSKPLNSTSASHTSI
ncbi:CoA-transferase [Bacillus pumilus]|uniref:CoA-transferase n=1 Tax=Bacillus pumilus TaxID=1408 RepID=UPI0034D96459